MNDRGRALARSALVEVALAAVVAVLAMQFATLHILRNLVHPPASLTRLTEFTAETPYQFRVLVPLLVRAIRGSGLLAIAPHTPLETARAIEVLALVGWYYALRALLACSVPRGAAAVLALGGFLVLPFQYLFPRHWPFWYPWDVPAVLFTTLGILLIRRRSWTLYYPLFALATLNRETSGFLTLVHLFVGLGEVPWRRLALHVAAQASIFVALKLLLAYVFRDNPGLGLWAHGILADNLAMIRKPVNWILLLSNFGFLWIPLLAGHPLVRDRFARRALWVVPIYVACVFFGAVFDELRVYGEMIPLVLLGCVCLGDALARRDAPSPATERSAHRSTPREPGDRSAAST